MKTWHIETTFVAAVLVGVAIVSGGRLGDWLTAFAVLVSFGHASVADRLAEREAAKPLPDVECWAWLRRYWVAKEFAWAGVFVVSGLWPALAGCALFAAHPIWRKLYRKRWPGPKTIRCMDCGVAYDEAMALDLVLPRAQWLTIHPDDGGSLCSACILRRASRLPGAINITGRITFASEYESGPTPYDKASA